MAIDKTDSEPLTNPKSNHKHGQESQKGTGQIQFFTAGVKKASLKILTVDEMKNEH